MIQERKKRSSSKANLIISTIFHAVVIIAVFFLAAREGILGKKLKELTVTMEKVKKPEEPKEKPPEPKPEPPKAAEAPKVSIPQPKLASAAPPPSDSAPAVAPAAAVLSGFEFSDGAKEVQSISTPNDIYKALVERTLRSSWNRPEDIADDKFVVQVELTIDPSGQIKSSRWVSGTGDARWDNSVKSALKETKVISRAPPKGFPEKFLVRFDVEGSRTETIQLSSSQ